VRVLRFLKTTEDLTKFQGAGEEPESRKARSPAYMTCENLNKSEGVYKNTHRINEKAFNKAFGKFLEVSKQDLERSLRCHL